MSGLLHLDRPLLVVPNVTAHPSTASVPITALLYDGPLLCGFNVAIKGLTTIAAYLDVRKVSGKFLVKGLRESSTGRARRSPSS